MFISFTEYDNSTVAHLCSSEGVSLGLYEQPDLKLFDSWSSTDLNIRSAVFRLTNGVAKSSQVEFNDVVSECEGISIALTGLDCRLSDSLFRQKVYGSIRASVFPNLASDSLHLHGVSSASHLAVMSSEPGLVVSIGDNWGVFSRDAQGNVKKASEWLPFISESAGYMQVGTECLKLLWRSQNMTCGINEKALAMFVLERYCTVETGVEDPHSLYAVSYTHLTLPTILLV